jgi:hypothetical protein
VLRLASRCLRREIGNLEDAWWREIHFHLLWCGNRCDRGSYSTGGRLLRWRERELVLQVEILYPDNGFFDCRPRRSRAGTSPLELPRRVRRALLRSWGRTAGTIRTRGVPTNGPLGVLNREELVQERPVRSDSLRYRKSGQKRGIQRTIRKPLPNEGKSVKRGSGCNN